MKKILSLTFLFCLLLTACGTELQQPESKSQEVKQPDEPTEITLWAYEIGDWTENSATTTLITKFNNTYPEYHLTIKSLDYTTGDDLVSQAIEDGTLPDLVFEGPERLIANWGSNDLMLDIADLVADANIYDNVKASCSDGKGAYYAYPICMTTHTMAINYDMFAEADALQYIDEENRTWTTENFLKAVEALHNNGQERVAAIYCAGQAGDQGTRGIVTNMYNGTFTDDTITSYTINSEENEKALQTLYDTEGIVFDEAITGVEEIQQFCSGELAMAFCWNSSIEVQNTVANPIVDFKVMPMCFPTESEDTEPRLQGGIWGFGIFKSGDEKREDGAKEFIKFITNSENYNRAVTLTGYWPTHDMEGIYSNDPLLSDYEKFNKYIDKYYQICPNWSTARTAWWTMLQQIGKGVSVSDAVDEFERTVGSGS